jgi:hypothetical protein
MPFQYYLLCCTYNIKNSAFQVKIHLVFNKLRQYTILRHIVLQVNRQINKNQVGLSDNYVFLRCRKLQNRKLNF